LYHIDAEQVSNHINKKIRIFVGKTIIL